MPSSALLVVHAGWSGSTHVKPLLLYLCGNASLNLVSTNDDLTYVKVQDEFWDSRSRGIKLSKCKIKLMKDSHDYRKVGFIDSDLN